MRFRNIKDLKGNVYDFTLENQQLVFSPTTNQKAFFSDDVFVSPGWIDIHTHCDIKNKFISSNPDQIGYQTGVCLVIDAGSTGVDNLDQLFNQQKNFKTNIKALLNISKIGIPGQYELNNLDDVQINYDLKKYRDFILGYKARISGSVVGRNGVLPLTKFKSLKEKQKLPTMIHIGNEPPTLEEIINHLEAGDILTHVFNGKNDKVFVNGNLSQTIIQTQKKGIKLDVGHGSSSFDSELFRQVLTKNSGFKPDFISTDIYHDNIKNGTVKNLATVMNKLHALGMNWVDILDCVTVNPAKHFKLDNFGIISPKTKDLTFFKLVHGLFKEKDSKGQEIIMTEKIVPVAVIVQGQFFEIEKGETMDIYKDLKLKKVINADGRMTILGVSTISNEVGEAMKLAGSNYFVMQDLQENIDMELAKMFGFETSHIVNSASAGISLATAALIYKERVHDVNVTTPEKNELILLKGQNINFGAPIDDLLHLVGAKVVEAGYANRCTSKDIEYRINEKTAGLIYIVSHHAVQKNILSLEEMIVVAKKYQLPLIVDCASESDIKKYANKELDLVIFSGAKAFEGPTSGIVFGKKAIIKNIVEHHKNIGRTMKVGKENLFGLYTALKNYQNKYDEIDSNSFLKVIMNNPYLDATIATDNLRPEIKRIKIRLNEKAKLNAVELSEQLKKGPIAIYLRDYEARQNYLEIDLRSINLEEMNLINKRVNELLGGQNGK